MFLHRLFGYRGVVLFPWSVRVYDRDKRENNGHKGSSGTYNPASGPGGKEVKGKTQTYYQVLIDSRDCPYITPRAEAEGVTYLGNHSDNSRHMYAIPGLDYVAHEDIMPYTTHDKAPIQHELFDQFLQIQETSDDECEFGYEFASTTS